MNTIVKELHFDRRVLCTSIGLVGLLALSGCGAAESAEGAGGKLEFPAATGAGAPIELDTAAWEELVTAAEAEGELVVYASQAGSDQTFEAFSEAYPEIQVTIAREVTSDLIARMDQEIAAGAGGADVTWHSQPAWAERNADEGALAALQFGPEAVEAGWPDFAVDDYYLPVMSNPYLIAWNSELAEPVENIQDLIAQAGDTPVGIAEPISQNGMFQLQTWVDAYGEGILGDLAALNHTVIRSTTPLSQSLAAGEIGYAILMTPGLVDTLQDEGAPVEQVVPNGELTGFAYGPMVLENAAHPAAAQLFANWLLTQETQQLIVDEHGPAALPIQLEATEGALAWEDVDPVDDSEWPQERRDEFRALWDSYFAS